MTGAKEAPLASPLWAASPYPWLDESAPGTLHVGLREGPSVRGSQKGVPMPDLLEGARPLGPPVGRPI